MNLVNGSNKESLRFKIVAIPGQKSGKYWRFKKDIIDQWFAATQPDKNR